MEFELKPSTSTLPKATFLKYPSATEKLQFCLSPDMQNFSNFLVSQIVTKPSLLSSQYEFRVPGEIGP